MEFRWLTPEERPARSVESGSLADVLALAQQLQAETEGLLSEEQVVEMGRELGIRPECVREALTLRQRAAQPAQALLTEPALAPGDERPLAAVGQALLLGFAMALFPAAVSAIGRSGLYPLPFVALTAAAITGWTARYPRLAAIGGALAVPAVLLAFALYPVGFFPYGQHGPGMDEAVVLSLLSFCPLCSVAGRAAAKLRRWAERLTDRPQWMVRGS
jgi:hypothetical protein